MNAITTRTVSIFRNGKNQAVRLPKEMQFEGIQELEMSKVGEVITLRPIRHDWLSFMDVPLADSDFLVERTEIVPDEGRFDW